MRRSCDLRRPTWPSCSHRRSTTRAARQRDCWSGSSACRGLRKGKEDRMSEVVVVTGASAGVGRAVAHAFARRGAHVGLIARGEQALEATAREIEELGGEAFVAPADVADSAQVEAAAERI